MILTRMVCTNHLLVSYFLNARSTVRCVLVRVLLVLYHFLRCWRWLDHRYPNPNLVDQPQALLHSYYQNRRIQNQGLGRRIWRRKGRQGIWQPCRWSCWKCRIVIQCEWLQVSWARASRSRWNENSKIPRSCSWIEVKILQKWTIQMLDTNMHYLSSQSWCYSNDVKLEY